MNGEDRPVCDCPEPCACYAEGYALGKEKAHFEIRAVLNSSHDVDCLCEPCKTVREVVRLKLMASGSPGLFERFEA